MREPALVPRVFSQAFHIMRSGRPGPVLIDLPLDVQLAEIEFDDETYSSLPIYKPTATRKQIEKAPEVALDRGAQLLQVIGARVAVTRFTCSLDCRQQQGDQQADDGNHHQQFDEGKTLLSHFHEIRFLRKLNWSSN